jgi:hypothetical protein
MKRARAGSTSSGALPAMARKRCHRAGVPAPTLVFLAREVGHEKEVEVRQVVGQVLGRQGQVGRQPAIGRRRDARGIGQRQRRRRRLCHRADAADARHQHQRVGRQLALQDLLEAAIQRRIDVGRGDPPVVDVERDFEIALDAVEGADDARGSFLGPLYRGRAQLVVGGARSRAPAAGVADFDSAASAMNQALGMSAGRPMRDAGHLGRGLEGVARLLEAGLGAADAGIAAAQAGTLAVPQPLVAIGMGLGALAAELLHQAALVGMLREALALNS